MITSIYITEGEYWNFENDKNEWKLKIQKGCHHKVWINDNIYCIILENNNTNLCKIEKCPLWIH